MKILSFIFGVSAISVMICLLLPLTGYTSLIYDNGSSTHSGGTPIDYYIVADDFVFSNDATITGVSVDVKDRPQSENGRWDGTVEWWILDNDESKPGNVIVSGTGQNIRESNMNVSPNDFRDFTVTFNFGQSISISKNRTYWLAIHFQADFNRRSVEWDHTSTIKNNAAYRGGELYGGVPDFNGIYSGPSHYDKAFRIYGEQEEGTGPWIRRGTKQLSPALAKWCELEYVSYHQKPRLVCDFPWALMVEDLDDDEVVEPSPYEGYRFSRNDSSRIGTEYRQALYNELSTLFRRDPNVDNFKNNLNRIGKIFESIPVGSRFDKKMKSSTIKKLNDSNKPNLELARMLVESLNAIELDKTVPVKSTIEIKAGDYSSGDLNGIAWLAIKDLKKTGKVILEIKQDVILPDSILQYIIGWPFGVYNFNFTGELKKSGYIDINFYVGGLYFPSVLDNLRIIELNGESCKDITLRVDVEKKIITGRTEKLTNYVIMIPIQDSSEE